MACSGGGVSRHDPGWLCRWYPQKYEQPAEGCNQWEALPAGGKCDHGLYYGLPWEEPDCCRNRGDLNGGGRSGCTAVGRGGRDQCPRNYVQPEKQGGEGVHLKKVSVKISPG